MSGRPRWLLLAVPIAVGVVFFAYPVLTLLDTGLRPDGHWELGAITDVLGDPGLRRVIWFTVWQALLSTALTVAVALPGAWLFARVEFPGRRVLEGLIVVPFVLPTVVVGLAFRELMPEGYQRGLVPILAAHVFFNYAVVARTVGSFWSQLDRRVEEAAAVLGASPGRVFVSVTLPRLAPALWASSVIVLLFTFTSFGVVLLLGDPAASTIEVEIQRQVLNLLDLPTAAALSLVQLVAVAALLVVQTRLERRVAEQPLAPPRRRRPRGRTLVGTVAVLATAVPLLLFPVAVLVERSFRVGDHHGLANWRALDETNRGTTAFVAPLDAVANSLRFAALATLLAVALGLLVAVGVGRATRADSIVLVPLGTSAVTLGVGMLLAFDEPPLELRRSVLLVPIAQALVATPFVVRAILPVVRSLRGRLREAAAVLGASPARVWWEVDRPLLTRPLLAAAGFAFAVSLGEFGATVFLARERTPTVPVLIVRLLGRPGATNLGQAFALATILAALTATAVVAFDRLAPGGRRG
jgi:thiamine transport system permease protein